MTTTKTTKTRKQSTRAKVRLNIRLWDTTKERLGIAAEKLGVSETDVIEMALREKFAKDGIE
jgi:antitoxin component of RelBE/YafQ-DinJ toxin-antitoxin module